MGRRTVMNLSRELKVSRPTIYRAIESLGIEKKAGKEYSSDEWELLKEALSGISESNRKKRADAKAVHKTAKTSAKKALKEIDGLSGVDTSTLQERLKNAKREFDYNLGLIEIFQSETDTYVKQFGKTTIRTHTGTETAIPSIANREKYIKLNIALSKLISDLEGDLDMSVDSGDDPFA